LGYAASGFDADHYGAIADAILQGRYTDVQRAPLYTAFVALIYALFWHSNAAVKTAQAFVDTGTAALIWSLGKRIAPASNAGRLSGLLYAAYPLAWWRCGFIGKEVLETFGLALFVWSFQATGLKQQLRSGLLLGLANLIKPILLGLPLAVAVWFWTQRKRLRAAAAQWLMVVLGMLVVVTPWTARNYLVTGEFVPVALENGGLTAFVGNFVPSLGAWEGPHKAEWEAAVAQIAAQHPDASQVELDRVYMRHALAEIAAQPARFPEMVALKLWRFWFANPSGRLGLLVLTIQLIVLGLAVIGLFQPRIPAGTKLFLGLVIGYLWLTHGLVYAEVRFSLPAAPCMMILAAPGITAVWARVAAHGVHTAQPMLSGLAPSESKNVRSQISNTSSGHNRLL
jgi:hypothetical protein